MAIDVAFVLKRHFEISICKGKSSRSTIKDDEPMVAIAGVAFGIWLGLRNATRRDGNLNDKLQYACGYGIAFGLLGVFLTLAIDWFAQA